MITTAEILKRAKAKIENPGHWCQGFPAKDVRGRSAKPHSDYAVRWCAIGALDSVSGRFDALWYMKARDCLMTSAIECGNAIGIAHLNDHSDHATVMRMYDLAIAKAEGET